MIELPVKGEILDPIYLCISFSPLFDQVSYNNYCVLVRFPYTHITSQWQRHDLESGGAESYKASYRMCVMVYCSSYVYCQKCEVNKVVDN